MRITGHIAKLEADTKKLQETADRTEQTLGRTEEAVGRTETSAKKAHEKAIIIEKKVDENLKSTGTLVDRAAQLEQLVKTNLYFNPAVLNNRWKEARRGTGSVGGYINAEHDGYVDDQIFVIECTPNKFVEFSFYSSGHGGYLPEDRWYTFTINGERPMFVSEWRYDSKIDGSYLIDRVRPGKIIAADEVEYLLDQIAQGRFIHFYSRDGQTAEWKEYAVYSLKGSARIVSQVKRACGLH